MLKRLEFWVFLTSLMAAFLAAMLTACDAVCPGQDVKELRAEKRKLEIDIARLQNDNISVEKMNEDLAGKNAELRKDQKVLAAIADGRRVRYVLKVSLRQIHYSLDWKKQFADAANEAKFDLLVDKESYDNARVGEDLFNAFRVGSALAKGSMGSWRIQVEEKNTVVEQ